MTIGGTVKTIDKPWCQHYTGKELNIKEIPTGTMYEFLFECNKENLQGIDVYMFETNTFMAGGSMAR